jgi:threonine dehydrogenase-like Zn-dependent dehydrogenase
VRPGDEAHELEGMKALHYRGPADAAVVDVPLQAPDAHEIVVRIGAWLTCTHWELTLWDGVDIFERPGHPKYPLDPGWPGHEWAGTVVETGPSVTRVEVGDHVAFWGSAPGDKRPSMCSYLEYKVAHEASVLRFPPEHSFPGAALLEMLTAVCSSVVRAGAVAGKRIGVSGLGAAGLLCVQALRALAPGELIGFDPVPERRELARLAGADVAVAPGGAEWQALRAQPLDLTVDCSGAGAALSAALNVTEGRVLVFGVPHGPVAFGPAQWRSGVTLEGYGGRLRAAADLARHLLVTRQVDETLYVTHTLPLEEYAKAVELLRRKEAIKVCLLPDTRDRVPSRPNRA